MVWPAVGLAWDPHALDTTSVEIRAVAADEAELMVLLFFRPLGLMLDSSNTQGPCQDAREKKQESAIPTMTQKTNQIDVHRCFNAFLVRTLH